MDTSENNLLFIAEGHSRKYHHLLRYTLPFLFVIAALIIGILVQRSSIHKKPSDKLLSKNISFALKESSPDNLATGFPVVGEPTFVFSKPLRVKEQDLIKYFSISPSVKGHWKLENNKQVVVFAANKPQTDRFPQQFEYDTVYKVMISKGITAVSGETIKDDTIIVFRTKRHPMAKLNSNYKLFATRTNIGNKLELYYPSPEPSDQYNQNVKERIHVSVYPSDVSQVMQYFHYSDNDRWNMVYFYEKTQNQHEFMTFDAEPYQDQLDSNRRYIDIPPFEKPGLYYLTLSDTYGKDDLIVSVSDHINQVFFDRDSSTVWVTDMKGTSLSDVSTTFYTVNNTIKLLKTGKTDSDGLYKYPNSSEIDFVVTSTGSNNYAISYTDRYADFSHHFYSIFAYSDRPVYKPGDSVHIKAITRLMEKGTYSVPKGTIYYRYLDGTYDTDSNNKYQEAIFDGNGTVSFDVTLPKEINGFPRVVYYTKNGKDYSEIYTQELTVQSYQKPDLDLTATTAEKEYISKDTSHITVYAKTLYGQPLANVEFTYRVLINDYYEVKDRKYEQIESSGYPYYGYGDTLTTGSGIFDRKGKADISFSTDLGTHERSQLLTVEITPKIGAAPSIGKIMKLVHRGEYALFFSNMKANIDDGISGDLLTLDHQTERKPYPNTELEVSLYKVVDYNNRTLLTTQTASTSAEGIFHIAFPNKEIGDYEIVARAKDKRENVIVERYRLYLGKKTSYSAIAQPEPIEMKVKQSSYQPGSEATVTVHSSYPLADMAIITTSNSGYSASTNTFDIRRNSPQSFELSVPISPQASGSIAISAYTVRDGKILESLAQVSVNTSIHSINTAISFDKQKYKPGETVKASIETTNTEGRPISADTSMTVIDGAILQITGMQGDIFNNFYNQGDYVYYISHYDSLTGIYTQRGGGGGGCFLNGTTVTMRDNTTKPIEDVVPGDSILTLESPFSDNLIEDTVTKTYRHVVDEYLAINGFLNVTPIHRLLINHQWKTAAEAKVGDTLLNENGQDVVIRSIVHHAGQYTVYNLTTSRTHTFIADGIYVHNDKGMTPRQNFVDTAYWNPHITTNQEGKASVSFRLPDNVTTYTTQVIANTPSSQFGETEAEFIVEKDVVIIPALAKFYYQNDKPVISALVQNTLSKAIQTMMTVTIKELNKNIQRSVNINPNDFETISFPIELNTNKNEIHILYELRDTKSGAMLDSVQVTQTLLPRENIVSDWKAYDGAFTEEFKPVHPQLDINSLTVNAYPHLAASLANNSYDDLSYFSSYESPSDPTHIYAASYIQSQAEEGFISPSLFKYAHIKNNLREKIDDIMAKRHTTSQKNSWWEYPDSYNKQSNGLYTALVTIALKEAVADSILSDISNASEIVKNAQAAITNKEVELYHTDEESVVTRWLLGYGEADDCANAYKSSCYASRAIHGDKKALEMLKSVTVPSNDDRYFWSTTSQFTKALPALAMITYGSDADADKAIKGLSFQYNSGSYSSTAYIALAAAVRHAIRRNLDLDTSAAVLYINDEKVFDWSKMSAYNTGLEYTFHTANAPNGTISVKLKEESGLPIYTTISTSEMSSGKKTPQAKNISLAFVRSYKSLDNGSNIQKIEQGKSAIVELKFTNPLINIFQDDMLNYTTFQLYDMMTPGFMFLNQYSDNSPEFQSQLRTIYPNFSDYNNYTKSYIQTTDYSDQSVYFTANADRGTLIMPYIVYRITDGEYFRPKTSLVFPALGIVATEH